MWQTLLALAPLGTVAIGLGTWTVVDLVRSCRRPVTGATGQE